MKNIPINNQFKKQQITNKNVKNSIQNNSNLSKLGNKQVQNNIP